MKLTEHGKPAHVVRPSPESGKQRRRKPPSAPAREYRPGYFLEPVYAGGTWPPGWTPAPGMDRPANEYHLDDARKIAMQRRVGFAADGGTVMMPGTPPRRGRPPTQKGY